MPLVSVVAFAEGMEGAHVAGDKEDAEHEGSFGVAPGDGGWYRYCERFSSTPFIQVCVLMAWGVCGKSVSVRLNIVKIMHQRRNTPICRAFSPLPSPPMRVA